MLLKQGIECPEIYFDICEYLPSIYYPKIKKKYAFGYIPHYNDSSMVLLADKENDIMIDICGQPEEIITQALSCNRIVSSSLHGLILADVYSIPRDWKRFDGVSDFKFYDYFSKFK
jgi:pyruvyltransferase